MMCWARLGCIMALWEQEGFLEEGTESIDWEGYSGRQDQLCRGSENTAHNLLESKGTVCSRAWVGPRGPLTCIQGVGSGGNQIRGPHLHVSR